MSAPISPKTVKFDDQLVHGYRSGSEYSSANSLQIYKPILNISQNFQQQRNLNPINNMSSSSLNIRQENRFQPIPISISSGSLYQQQPAKQTSPQQHQNLQEQFAAAAGRVGFDTHDRRFRRSEGVPPREFNDLTRRDRFDSNFSEARGLDEIAMDLLRLSTEPAIAVFNNRSRSLNDQRLQKAASTSSMPKRTGLLKVYYNI